MNPILYWIVTGATWVSIGISIAFTLKMRSRNKAAWAAYDRCRDVAVRAMDRADWALHGIQIVLKWAGVDDIPGGVVDRGNDPRGSMEQSPRDGGERPPEVQG